MSEMWRSNIPTSPPRETRANSVQNVKQHAQAEKKKKHAAQICATLEFPCSRVNHELKTNQETNIEPGVLRVEGSGFQV